MHVYCQKHTFVNFIVFIYDCSTGLAYSISACKWTLNRSAWHFSWKNGLWSRPTLVCILALWLKTYEYNTNYISFQNLGFLLCGVGILRPTSSRVFRDYLHEICRMFGSGPRLEQELSQRGVHVTCITAALQTLNTFRMRSPLWNEISSSTVIWKTWKIASFLLRSK